ncbi:MAG: hypothetical protein ACPG8W_16415 [Candidatus Promineifilaceae bacterium]
MRVLSRKFSSSWVSWEELLYNANEFATSIGPNRLINISHSEDSNEGVVIVWYWSENIQTMDVHHWKES